MEIGGPTLRLDSDELQNSALMSLELPDGSASGGLLVPKGGTRVFVLFADEDLEVGDEVVAPPEERFLVTSVRHAYLDEQPVTVLSIRPREDGDS